MIVPSTRLLWVAALTVLPLAAIGGMVAGAALPCVLGIAAIVLAAGLDAMRGYERLAAVSRAHAAISQTYQGCARLIASHGGERLLGPAGAASRRRHAGRRRVG